MERVGMDVLNLIINGLPSILFQPDMVKLGDEQVLNLIINGLPSIHSTYSSDIITEISFKPYYKWITFNT